MKKYKPAGGSIGIPAIWIIKPNGEQAHFQSGAGKFVETLNKFSKELTKAVVSTKRIGLMKSAAKEADAFLEQGKFVSAYEQLSDYAEDLKTDNKALSKVKATFKKIEDAALEKIDSAQDLVEKGLSEAKRFDGAFQLTVIAGSMKDLESVNEKAEAAIKRLKAESKFAELFKQASEFYAAREAAKEEDTAKAKKLYEKVIADFKGTEVAKRAKAKLEELKAADE